MTEITSKNWGTQITTPKRELNRLCEINFPLFYDKANQEELFEAWASEITNNLFKDFEPFQKGIVAEKLNKARKEWKYFKQRMDKAKEHETYKPVQSQPTVQTTSTSLEAEDWVYLGNMVGSFYSAPDTNITVTPGLLFCGIKTRKSLVPQMYEKVKDDPRYRPALAHMFARAGFCAPGYSKEQFKAEMAKEHERELAVTNGRG